MVLTAPVKLFVLPRFRAGADIRLLDVAQVSAQAKRAVLFKDLPADFSLTGFVRTERPEDADYLIVPQSVRTVDASVDLYLDEACELARAQAKEVILFLTGDLCHKVHVDRPEVIVFKGSEYRHALHENEVIFAPFVEDLGQGPEGWEPRTRRDRPVVSFCGYAGFPSWKTRLKYVVTNLALDLRALISSRPLGVFKRGIYFRRAALRALENDSRFEKSFIARNSFSGNGGTVTDDPRKIREEYVRNIRESDFVLAPKGDANFSSRFYETLSLGRIPVLIDTDMILPFEDRIDYDSFMVRVPFSQVSRTGDYIYEWYEKKDEAAFKEAQETARRVFRDHLRFDSYWNEALSIAQEKGIRVLVSGS